MRQLFFMAVLFLGIAGARAHKTLFNPLLNGTGNIPQHIAPCFF